MRLSNEIKLIDKTALIGKTLIFADTHIGYETSLNKQGMLLPMQNFESVLGNIDNILKKVGKIREIVIDGDIKDDFGSISDQEWRLSLKFIDHLSSKCKKIVLVKGNHDTMLEPIAKKRNVVVVDYYRIGDNLIIHGDKIPGHDILKGIDTIIIGHEHPAISIKEGSRIELFKCFLVGKWKKKDLIVLPSFNMLNEGHDVTKEENLSPFLNNGFSNFKAYLVGDKVYDFGKVKNIKGRLKK